MTAPRTSCGTLISPCTGLNQLRAAAMPPLTSPCTLSAVARQETETELRQAIESSVHRIAALALPCPLSMRALFASGVGSSGRTRKRPGADFRQLPRTILPACRRPRYGGRRGDGSTRTLAPPHARIGARLRVRDGGRGFGPHRAHGAVGSGPCVPPDGRLARLLVPAPGTRVSINLSNREFWDPRFLDQFDRVLLETGAPSDLIALEINEGVIMEDVEGAASI